jgi:gentisate 1,2-dioxygenase
MASTPVTNAEYGFEGRFEDWTADARYYEYSKVANPIGSGHMTKMHITRFSRELYAGAGTGIIPLDLSANLGIATGPATSPGLLASFIRIRAGEQVATSPNATSQLYYAIEGRGFAAVNGRLVQWEKGDFLTLPSDSHATFYADADAAFYWVHDEPLLRYLGVEATKPRFRATKFPRERSMAKMAEIAAQPGANDKSRGNVLLANAEEDQTLSITHVLWAMLGILPAGQEQRPQSHQSLHLILDQFGIVPTGQEHQPHRHQSLALNLILDATPGCYTLLCTRLDEHGNIANPVRVDWEPGGAFVIPPGMWHAHYNESGARAHFILVQDAGLHTYLRSLDIHYTGRR